MSAAAGGRKTDSRQSVPPIGEGEHFAFIGDGDDVIYGTVLEVLPDGYRVCMFHPSGPETVDEVRACCIEFRLSSVAMDHAKASGWPQSAAWLNAHGCALRGRPQDERPMLTSCLN